MHREKKTEQQKNKAKGQKKATNNFAFSLPTRAHSHNKETDRQRETATANVPLQSINMLAVKNFFLPERTKAPETPQRFSRMPEAFLRSIRRRSLRVKRAKSLVVPDREKRKSGEVQCRCKCDESLKLPKSMWGNLMFKGEGIFLVHFKDISKSNYGCLPIRSILFN